VVVQFSINVGPRWGLYTLASNGFDLLGPSAAGSIVYSLKNRPDSIDPPVADRALAQIVFGDSIGILKSYH
jgi:hypothetical protein